MIVLDTNVFPSDPIRPPGGPIWAMLQIVARETNHQLGLPEMVRTEYLAHVRHAIEQAHQAVSKAVRELQLLAPSWDGALTKFDVEGAVGRWTEQLQVMMEILPTPQNAPLEALNREANRQLPAKKNWNDCGSGARDVVVWLTALEACRTAGGETYFVSKDQSAFGKNNQLYPELRTEVTEVLGDNAGWFHYCCGFGALLAELAEKVDTPLDREKVAAAETVREAVTEAQSGPAVHLEILSAMRSYPGQKFLASSPVNDLTLLDVRDIKAYQIAETTWATTRTTWSVRDDFTVRILNGLTDFPAGGARSGKHKSKIDATLVMQLDSNGNVLSAEVSESRRTGFKIDFD